MTLDSVLRSKTTPLDAVSEILSRSHVSNDMQDTTQLLRGGWGISREFAHVLVHAVRMQRRRNVIEFGAGDSSRVLAQALARAGGGALTSVESNPEWCRDSWNESASTEGVECTMLTGTPHLRLNRMGLVYEYNIDRSELVQKGVFDLVVIDGPQWWFGREGAISLIHKQLAQGALIIVDDAGRRPEMWAIWKWLRSYRSLFLRFFDPSWGNGKGLAVLSFDGGASSCASPSAFVRGVYHGGQRACRNWRRLRESSVESQGSTRERIL